MGKEPHPCCVSDSGSSSPVVFAGLCFSVEQQHSSGMCCMFGKSFPTAQPLSRAFGSAAVKM